MVVRWISVGALAALAGCGGFDQRDAETVARASSRASTSAYAALAADLAAPGADSGIGWTPSTDGNVFTGILTGDGRDWTGEMVIDGEMVGTDAAEAWSLTVLCEDVTIDGTTLNGAIGWEWALTDHDVGFWVRDYAAGELAATGEADGRGAIETTTSFSVDEDGLDAYVEGLVDGHDVVVEYSAAWNLAL